MINPTNYDKGSEDFYTSLWFIRMSFIIITKSFVVHLNPCQLLLFIHFISLIKNLSKDKTCNIKDSSGTVFVIHSNLSSSVITLMESSNLIEHLVGHHCLLGLRFQNLPKTKLRIYNYDHNFHSSTTTGEFSIPVLGKI